MQNTRVKICGITRPEDALRAAEYGADFIGLNFVAGPRKIDRETAQRIQYEVPSDENPKPNLKFVGLCAALKAEFPHALEWDEVPRVLIRTFQIYARSYSKFELTTELGFEWWMVRHLTNRDSMGAIVQEITELTTTPAALLLDTASPKLGGTGQSFNWNWIAEARNAGELENLPPLILAGGLSPDNVADAIRIAQPYAVDVSSGVEVAGKPGIKDPIKMRDFIQAAKSA